MKIIQHSSNNMVFSAPKEYTHEECVAAPVTIGQFENNIPFIRSYWKPSEKELRELMSGKLIVLTTHGRGMQPTSLEIEE